MIRYRAFMNGAYYYADVTPSPVVDGYDMRVYHKTWKGEEVDDFTKEYKTVAAAEASLKKRWPEAKWERV